jgi:hypothetical protein
MSEYASFRDFSYRGLSMSQLDEMIYTQKLQGHDGIIEENARLRQENLQLTRQGAMMIISDDTHYSIHSTKIHSCGQVFEEVLHLKQDETFLLNFHMPPFPPLMNDHSVEAFEAFMHEAKERKQKIELAGNLEKIEINGMQWNEGKGITCLHCGEELLFPTQKSGGQP